MSQRDSSPLEELETRQKTRWIDEIDALDRGWQRWEGEPEEESTDIEAKWEGDNGREVDPGSRRRRGSGKRWEKQRKIVRAVWWRGFGVGKVVGRERESFKNKHKN